MRKKSFATARKDQILTILTRDIQCEKFIEDESVSHEPCDSILQLIYTNRSNQNVILKNKVDEHSN